MEDDVYKTEKFRSEAIRNFLSYQTIKYNLTNVATLQREFYPIVFEKEECSIGEIQLKDGSIYLCDAIVPNSEIKNVLLEVKRIKDEWLIIMSVNFFGLKLCVHLTKEKNEYPIDGPITIKPRFKIICKADDSSLHRNDNMP
ncbi:MAG: hypothetical protein NDI62_00435 [Burkholderiales bacterium]|nr:hypothetical protein [Burkholderiales bacterium]